MMTLVSRELSRKRETIMNFYTLQNEAEQRAHQLRIEADAHRLSRTRAQDLDNRSIREYSAYLGQILLNGKRR